MPEQLSARIRAWTPRDDKEVRFMVGQAQMEPLAYANNRSKVFSSTIALSLTPTHDPPVSLLPQRTFIP